MGASVTRWILEKEQVRILRKWAYASVNFEKPFDGGEESAFAQLALLRALTLERELRRASWRRDRESVAMLTRAGIESIVMGMYLLLDAEASNRLGKGTQNNTSRMFEPWLPDGQSMKSLTDALTSLDDVRNLPNLRQVCDAVDAACDLGTYLGRPFGDHLYVHWHIPLSNLAVHTTGASLSRYYNFRRFTIRKHPWGAIPRRGAIRTVDGAIAKLAALLMEHKGMQSEPLRKYGTNKLNKANVPIPVVMFRCAVGQGMKPLIKGIFASFRYGRIVESSSSSKEVGDERA